VISEEAFASLDAPIRRVASLDTPVPYAPTLEECFLPNSKKVAGALRLLAAY
jgi:pyruvate/2-oxoglutarate/acetoin dehydrogenase E1 component